LKGRSIHVLLVEKEEKYEAGSDLTIPELVIHLGFGNAKDAGGKIAVFFWGSKERGRKRRQYRRL